MWTLFWANIASLFVLTIIGLRSGNIAGVYFAVCTFGAAVVLGVLALIVRFLP